MKEDFENVTKRISEDDRYLIKSLVTASKHPHAAMICVWLDLGCNVQFWEDAQEIWEDCVYEPVWDIDTKYRLVHNPAVTRPAFRVYLDEEGELCILERSGYGVLSDDLAKETVFLTEWVFYGEKPEI